MNQARHTRGLGIAAVIGGLFVILVAAGCGDRFPDPSQEGEFDRTVLLEEATGTWCTYCPEAAENIETLIEANTGTFIVLALHSGDDYSTNETEARITKLGVKGFPTIIFDGVEESDRAVSEMQTMLDSRRALGSPVKIALSASLTADSVFYEITVIASDKASETIEGTLRIALIEDTITDASVGLLLHHIVRRLPEAGGSDALTLEPGDTLQLHRALPLDQSWGRPLGAVVWVEGADLEVYQAAAYELGGGSPDEGDFSIEVVGDSIKTDTLGAMVNFNFTLRNHTTTDLTLTADVPEATQELPTGWWFSLCDESNCYPVPHDFEVPASDKLEGIHVTVGSYTEGTEGKLVLTVTDGGEEVDKQSFTLKIAQ
jgi:thiol-disulfide isomerase/thioredoxin